MIEKNLERGTVVDTERGPGYIVKVDTVSYTSPLYHVLLISSKYAGKIVYTSNPRITTELHSSTPKISMDELYSIRTELAFNIKRNLITGVVICPQCHTRYHEVNDTEVIDIENDNAIFYCVECGERL